MLSCDFYETFMKNLFYNLNKEKVAGINCRKKILATFATFPSCYNGFFHLSQHLIPITLNFCYKILIF